MKTGSVLEMLGLMAALFAIVCFVRGRHRRLAGAPRIIVAVLLGTTVANSAMDLTEHFFVDSTIDLVEDYLDVVLMMAWALIVFALLAAPSSDQASPHQVRRELARQTTFVLVIFLALNMVYAIWFFLNARTRLNRIEGYHRPSLVSVLALRSQVNDAIQEAFAYVVSGEKTEKKEFQDRAKEFAAEAEALRRLAPSEGVRGLPRDTALNDVLGEQRELVDLAERVFQDYELIGRVKPETFKAFEDAIDGLAKSFDRLEKSERDAFDEAQRDSSRLLAEASREVPLLGGLSIALMVGLFVNLSWSFRLDVASREEASRTLMASEQKYRSLVEQAPEAIVVLDVDSRRFIEVNESALFTFRLSRDELLKVGPIELSPPFQPDGRESASAAMGYVKRALQGHPQLFEWIHCDAEGNELPTEIRLSRLASDRRLVRGAISDIKQRIEFEKTLSQRALEAELLYRAVKLADETDSLGDALQLCVNIVCEMISWPVGHVYLPTEDANNDANVKLVSAPIWYLADEARFRAFREVTEQTTFAAGEGLPGRIWQSGRPEWIEDIKEEDDLPRARLGFGIRGAFGFPIKVRGKTVAVLEFFTEFPVDLNETLLLLVQSVGEQVGRVIERQESNHLLKQRHAMVAQELDATRRELVQGARFAAVGQMSAQVAHEMRNPLGAVSNAVFYLRRKVPAGERKWQEYLDLIDGEVTTCNRFIGDLLDVTRGKVPNRTWIELNELIDQAMARHQFSDQVDVRVTSDPVPFPLYVDSGQLVQVMDNLMKNSLDAIDDGPGCIEIHAYSEPEHDIITFHDTGAGIPESRRQEVFDVLFTTKASGTGLGLPICKQIVEKHGGTIDLLDGKVGTTMQIRLPRVQIMSRNRVES